MPFLFSEFRELVEDPDSIYTSWLRLHSSLRYLSFSVEPRLVDRLKSVTSFVFQVEKLLSEESGIYRRILYKRRNMHKNAKFFQRSRQISAKLKVLGLDKLFQIMQLAVKKCQTSKKNFLNQPRLTSLEDAYWEYLLFRIYGVHLLLVQVGNLMVSAFQLYSSMIAITNFLPFCVITSASLARMFILCRHLDAELTALFNQIRPHLAGEPSNLLCAKWREKFGALPAALADSNEERMEWDSLDENPWLNAALADDSRRGEEEELGEEIKA